MTTSAGKRANLEPVVKRITVRCSAEDAFRYFTSDFQKWWPAHTHSVIAMSSGGARQPSFCSFEPRLGGCIIEHGAGEERYVWGTVLAWDPPRKVAFTWHPGRDRQTAQTVDVTFSEAGGATEVVLTHSGFERLAEAEGAVTREAYDNGGEGVFNSAFREYVEQRRHA